MPTTYKALAGTTIPSNQYSVTENYVGVAYSSGMRTTPGVFFHYDLHPIRVRPWAGCVPAGLVAECGGG